MTVFVGALLAAGVLLCVSPWMWPPSDDAVMTMRQGRLARLIEEAGMEGLSQRGLLAIVVATGLMTASGAWLLTGIPVLSVLAGLAGATAPIVFLRGRRMRLRRLRRQLWPDVCDLLIASIRVGLSLPDAVAGLAESAPKMLRPAFIVFARDLRASGRFETSLDRLKTTLSDPIGDRIAETLRMARQVGGTELISVLRALSSS